jgi:uncharacterized protein YciI
LPKTPSAPELQAALRLAHLAHAEKARRDGILRLAGAFNPPDGALLVPRRTGKTGQ